MQTLIVRHLAGDDTSYRFQLWRPDGKSAEAVELPAPESMGIEGRPDSHFGEELRWYLEQFLDYPFEPLTDWAERVQAALWGWGEQIFSSLFGSGRGRDFYGDAYRVGLENLTLKIASDDPWVLAWPWEALATYAQNRRDFANARRYFENLAKHMKARSKPGREAAAYHNLGIIAREQRDFAEAEQWYRKSLAIKEKQGNEHGAAITYNQLGVLAGIQQNYIESGRWTLKAIRGFVNSQDPHRAQQAVRNFLIIFEQAPPTDQTTLKSLWDQADLGPFPADS